MTLKLLALLVIPFVPAVARAHGDLDRQIGEVSRLIAVELGKPVDGHERAKLYLERGELHRLHADWKQAAADYDQAAAYEPDLGAVELARGRMLLGSGEPAAARKVLEHFLRAHVDHPEALLLHAQALVKLGHGVQAVRLLDRALARHPQPEPDHYLARADVLAALGPRYLPRAVRGLDQGIKRLGSLVSLDTRAIEIDLELGRWDRALYRIDRQAALTIRKDLWLARRAEVLERAGRGQAARAARESAIGAIAALPPHVQTRPATIELRQRLTAALVPPTNPGGQTGTTPHAP